MSHPSQPDKPPAHHACNPTHNSATLPRWITRSGEAMSIPAIICWYIAGTAWLVLIDHGWLDWLHRTRGWRWIGDHLWYPFVNWVLRR